MSRKANMSRRRGSTRRVKKSVSRTERIRQRKERQQRRERLYARKPGRRPKVYRQKLYGEGGTKKSRPEIFRPIRGWENGVAWGGKRYRGERYPTLFSKKWLRFL